MYRGEKFYECPFCDMIMPNKKRDKDTHTCNPFDVARKQELEELKQEIKRRRNK